MQRVVTKTKATGADYPTERIMSIYGLAAPKDEDVDMLKPQVEVQPSGGASSAAQPSGGPAVGQQAAPMGPSGSAGPPPVVQVPPAAPVAPVAPVALQEPKGPAIYDEVQWG